MICIYSSAAAPRCTAIRHVNTSDRVARRFISAQGGQVECVRILCQAKAEINLPNNDGETPLCDELAGT